MMKLSFFHLTVLCILVAAWSTDAPGQIPVRMGFQGGINLGGSTASPTTVTLGTRVGFMIGGMLQLGLSEMIFFEPEVYYVQKGATYTVPGSNGTGEVVWKFDYIEVPLLLKAKFGSEKSKLVIFGGPNFGFNQEAQIWGSAGSTSQSVDVKDAVEAMDIAIDIGAGGEFLIDPGNSFVLNIRYSNGLTDIDRGESSSWKLSGVQFTAGLLFDL